MSFRVIFGVKWREEGVFCNHCCHYKCWFVSELVESNSNPDLDREDNDGNHIAKMKMALPFAWQQQWTNDLFPISTPFFIFLISITSHQNLLDDHHIYMQEETPNTVISCVVPSISRYSWHFEEIALNTKECLFWRTTFFMKVNIRSRENCFLCHTHCIYVFTAAIIGEKGQLNNTSFKWT